MARIVDLVEEYRQEAIDQSVGEDLSGARPKTLLELVDAARAVEDELAEMLAKIGERSETYERLRQALIQLDVELSRAPEEPAKSAAE